MNESWQQVREWAKHGIAFTLFVLLLIGGGAMFLTAVAQGVHSLASMQGQNVYSAPGVINQSGPSTAGGVTAQNQFNSGTTANTSNTSPSEQENVVGAALSNSPSSVTAQWNQALDDMHSPIGTAIDSGGVALGNQVQKVFGSLLSGVLQTLFVEQSDGSANNSAVSGNQIQSGPANGQ